MNSAPRPGRQALWLALAPAGKVFEATGAYDWVWYADVMLAAGAALVHLPIREALPRAAAAAPAPATS